MLTRMLVTASASFAFLVPSFVWAEPSELETRVQEATRAIEECVKRSCAAAEMKEKFAALEAAREALEASPSDKMNEVTPDATTPPAQPAPPVATVGPVEPPTEAYERVPTRPESAPEPGIRRPNASWIAPPEYRVGAPPLPPPDTSEGEVHMRLQHLGVYWAGLGLLTGGGIGLAASGGWILDNAEGAQDFEDIGPGVVLGGINFLAVITGAALLGSGGKLVPETSARLEPTRRGVALRF